MRHLNELRQEEWFKKDWIVLGTGPSLDNFDQGKYPNCNIATVYCANEVCDTVDIQFVSDIEGFPVTHSRNVRHVATRSINNQKLAHFGNLVFWEYDCDVRIFQNGQQLFPHHNPYPCSNTSSFIIMFLGMAGIKKIYTCGIDGGNQFAKRINREYVAVIEADLKGKDIDFENDGVYGHARNYGIELIRI